jgi:hypothetical protein
MDRLLSKYQRRENLHKSERQFAMAKGRDHHIPRPSTGQQQTIDEAQPDRDKRGKGNKPRMPLQYYEDPSTPSVSEPHLPPGGTRDPRNTGITRAVAAVQ